MKNFVKICASAFMGVFLSAGGAFAATELIFQTGFGPGSEVHDSIEAWTNSFEEKSDGELIFDHFPVNSIVDGFDVVKAVKDGMLDSGVGAFIYAPKETPYAFGFSMPGLVLNTEHGTKLAYKLYETMPEFRKDVDSIGEMLYMWATAGAAIVSNTPIRSPEDLKGKRVIIVEPNNAALVEAWGGIPVFTGPSDVYIGLQRGMGEAMMTTTSYHKSLRTMEVAKYITQVPGSVSVTTVSMNRELFEEDLNAEEKELLKGASGEVVGLKTAQAVDKDIESALALFEEEIVLTPEELAVFQEASQQLIENYWKERLVEVGIEGNVDDYIDTMFEVSRQTAQELGLQ